MDHTLTPSESRIRVGAASLYARVAGQGEPVVVLHGGPDFDHGYLLPDLDRLANAFRLIYYDQRGRGRSASTVQPDDVTLASEVDDLDRVCEHLGLEAPALLGHSWGAVLALEYALRHPTRVSRLILMNPTSVAAGDAALVRDAYVRALGADMDEQRAILASAAYQEGDPEAVVARYRIHFKHALKHPVDYDRLIVALEAAFVRQGREGIVKAQAIEDRLMRDTSEAAGYDLIPRLGGLHVPTLVIAGSHDLIPVEVAARIARAIRNAEFVTIEDCGHFAYLEQPDRVRGAMETFFRRCSRDTTGP